MSFLSELKAEISERGQLLVALAIGIIVISVLGDLVLIGVSVSPKWQVWTQVSERLIQAQEHLALAEHQQQGRTVEQTESEIAEVEQKLRERGDTFLSKAEAAEALNHVYRYADETGVGITRLEGRPADQEEDGSPLYDLRTFDVEANGSIEALINFMGSIEESAHPGFIVTGVDIGATEDGPGLRMTILLYTSPYAEADLRDAEEVGHLQDALVQAWDRQRWQQAIDLLTRITDQNPSDESARVQLSQAHINYGKALLAEARAKSARVHFEAALQLAPDDVEATHGLRQATQQLGPPPTTREMYRERLDRAWSREDWSAAIAALDHLFTMDPQNAEWRDKRYAAYVNRGHQLASEGRRDEAKAAFSRALTIKSNGGEAVDGLRRLATLPGPPPVETSSGSQ